ncbi:MAG: MEDS domain-containing protein [Alphaproteobacteria bacterium]
MSRTAKAHAVASDGTELLNIKQAAALLNVSEVSLRRWTDSGRLACLRIGPKRERRFRREDLNAFLVRQCGPAMPSPESANTKVNQVHLEGMNINYGTHLCSFYESDLGRVKLAVPFLAEGLRNGDACFLFGSAGTRDHVLAELGNAHDGLKAAIDSGQLFLSGGMESARATYEALERAFVAATRSGNRSLRSVCDKAWFLDKGMNLEDLTEFELRYNHSLAHRFPVVALCQYDVRRFSGVGILNALKCHEDTFKFPMNRFLGV